MIAYRAELSIVLAPLELRLCIPAVAFPSLDDFPFDTCQLDGRHNSRSAIMPMVIQTAFQVRCGAKVVLSLGAWIIWVADWLIEMN